ncbi:MAG: cell division protein FtsW [Bacteroidetes bacterium]|jgi:cell division protein FtsW|nr:cell division protein FtsW [Bacteroidota bacterium]NBX63988.1 cell division protein FtsW [Bacteroidota bacterium]
MNSQFTSRFKGDKWIWFVIIILSLIGILAVYSATGTLAYSKQGGNTEWYFLRHTGFLLIGLGLLYLTHLIPFSYYSRISQIFLWISIGLLGLTLVIGSEINNATRVIPIPGLGITFQPSDMAKLFLVMYISRYLSKNQEEIDSPRVFWVTLAYILLVVGLIAPENLSTSLVVFLTAGLLMFIGRVNFKYMMFLTFSGVGLISVLVVVLLNINTDGMESNRIPTWKKRIETFMGKDDGQGNYQQLQSKIAVATGGVFGKGPGNSTQRNYLPHPYSDFIYAIIVEEYGLLGGLVVAGCFLILVYRCLKIVVESPRAFGALVAMGLGLSMSLQAFVNMGVAVGMLPVTGLTIPLVSMGGTSLFMNSIGFGIILGISKYIEEEKQQQSEAITAGI